MAELAQRVLAWNRVAANRRNTRLLLALLALLLVPFLSGLTVWVYPWFEIPAVLYFGRHLDEASISPAQWIGFFVIGLTAAAVLVVVGGVLLVLFLVWRFGARRVLRSLGAQPWPAERYPGIRRLVENLCLGVGLPAPQLRFIDSAVPNALAVGRTPADATIAVSRGLVELLDEREVAGVLAHEISHVANEDTRLSTIVAAIVASVAWPITAWLRLLRARWTAVRVFGLFVGLGVAQVVLATLAMLAFLLAQGPGAFDLGGILGDGAPANTQAPASPHVPMPRWVTVGLYAWSLHATTAPFYILVVAPAIAFMVRRAVSRQREFLADADAVVLTRDPEGLALALTKIGAAHGTLRSAESIAHLFIAPPRPSDRWFDRLFPTHPAIESRVDVLARMGAGLDRAEVAKALEAGQRHQQAQAAEEGGRSAKALRGGRPRYPGIETVPAETADAGDANPASGTATTRAQAVPGIPVYERPDGWSAVLAQLDVGTEVARSGAAVGEFLEITLPDGRSGWVARTAPLRSRYEVTR